MPMPMEAQDEPESAQEAATETPETEQQEWTTNPDHVYAGAIHGMDANHKKALDRVIDAGKKLIFGKDTHDQIMAGLENADESSMPQALSDGAVSVASILYKKSGGTMPGEIIIPAGTVLMALVCDYLSKSGRPMSDQIFEQAAMQFKDKMEKAVSGQDKSTQDQGSGTIVPDNEQSAPPAVAQPQQPGLLQG